MSLSRPRNPEMSAAAHPAVSSRRRRRRVGLAGTCAVAMAALLAACGGSSGSSAKGPTQSITVYSGQHQATTQSLAAAFEKQTGIKVNVRYDDEDTFEGQIATLGTKTPADVFYTENTPPLVTLQEKGLLDQLPASITGQTAAKYDSSNGDWVGVSARVSVLIYNPSKIKASQLPTTALALAEPRYKGKLALAAGESDFYSVVTSMDKAYGPTRTLKWLEALKSNAGSTHTYPDNETIADEVNRGAVAFGLVNQYYYYRLEGELGKSNVHSAIVHFAPRDPGYVVDVSGAGVLKSSKDPAAADKFVAFLVSKQGQEIIHHSLSFEYPLDHGVAPGANETPFSQLQPNPISIAQLGNGAQAIALMQKAGLL